LVRIEISDYVWERYKLYWALFGIREHQKLVNMLADDLLDRANSVIEDTKKELIDDEAPEALARREMGLNKEKTAPAKDS
jgi:hypothetical protein